MALHLKTINTELEGLAVWCQNEKVNLFVVNPQPCSWVWATSISQRVSDWERRVGVERKIYFKKWGLAFWPPVAISPAVQEKHSLACMAQTWPGKNWVKFLLWEQNWSLDGWLAGWLGLWLPGKNQIVMNGFPLVLYCLGWGPGTVTGASWLLLDCWPADPSEFDRSPLTSLYTVSYWTQLYPVSPQSPAINILFFLTISLSVHKWISGHWGKCGDMLSWKL